MYTVQGYRKKYILRADIKVQSTLTYLGLTYLVPSLSAYIWLGIDLFSAFIPHLTGSLGFNCTIILGAKVGISPHLISNASRVTCGLTVRMDLSTGISIHFGGEQAA